MGIKKKGEKMCYTRSSEELGKQGLELTPHPKVEGLFEVRKRTRKRKNCFAIRYDGGYRVGRVAALKYNRKEGDKKEITRLVIADPFTNMSQGPSVTQTFKILLQKLDKPLKV